MWRVLLLLFLFGILKTGADPDPLVETQFGFLHGKWMMTTYLRNDRKIECFLGIPYAEPPVDDLRFKSPKAWSKKWTGGKLNATEDGPMCMQMDSSNNTIGSEDCLYLNVFRPEVPESNKATKKFSVLVFIHGGGFKTGSSDSNLYGPEYLLNEDIILVTLNYRLGFLGFMSTSDENAPGNNGLKDIVTALQWVQQNVASFGGNPNSVTLDGYGAGAAAVHLLVLSDKSKGLFNRYVMQSGSGRAPWAFRVPEINREATLQIAEQLNCTDNDNQTERIIDCLRELNATDIVEASFWEQISPTVEPEYTDDAVLTNHPKIRMEENKMLNVPHIVGVVQDEGLQQILINQGSLTENISITIEQFVSVYEDTVNNFTDFVEELSSFYFDNNITQNIVDNLTELVSDALVIWPVYETLLYDLKAEIPTEIYFYNLEFEGQFCLKKKDEDDCLGVSHMDGIDYLFPYSEHLKNASGFEDSQKTIIRSFVEMWTNFAIKGTPKEKFSTKRWDRYEVNQTFMMFSNSSADGFAMEYNFLPERMKFWKELMEKFELDITSYEHTCCSGGSFSPSPFIFLALIMYFCM